MSAETGASLPCAGMTALQSLKTVAGFGLEGNYKGTLRTCGNLPACELCLGMPHKSIAKSVAATVGRTFQSQSLALPVLISESLLLSGNILVTAASGGVGTYAVQVWALTRSLSTYA